jgi:hypothetical protein
MRQSRGGAHRSTGGGREAARQRRWLKLSARVEECEREPKSEGKRCRLVQGRSSPFIEGGGALGRQQRVVTVGLMALKPFVAGGGY